MSLTMNFPFELAQVFHEYDRPFEVDLARKYKEGAAILGEWRMVEACLHTDRADAVISLFESLAKAKAEWDEADLALMCITRRTHPVARVRWDAESKATDVLVNCHDKYKSLLLALRILLVGEAAVKAHEARMDLSLDECDPVYMGD
jgi:hypothetical protein